MRSQETPLLARLGYDLRVIRACMLNDARIALRTPTSIVFVVLLPVNFLILELLFVISGGLAPTAIVMQDTGQYAQQFVQAMRGAHSFNIVTPDGTTLDQAEQMLRTGNIVAVITVPAQFDDDLKAGRQVVLSVEINNLNVDFTNDVRRAVPLAITQFYAQTFPNQVVIQAKEIDVHAQDTDYIPYLAVSILVISLMMGGLLQAGTSVAHEYETNTVKDLLLSPASRWAIQTGKLLGSLSVNLGGTLIILAVVVLALGVHPLNWLELIVFAAVMMPIFGSFGILVGTLLRSRRTVIPLTFGLALPLFFLSGPFGPVTFGSSIAAILAQFSPAYYGIAVFQHAFHDFHTTPTSTTANLIILIGFAVAALALSTIVLRRTSLAH